jgi:DNA polymerase III, alpha subunit
VAPVYLWGTYDALKDTYGQLIYQEQVSRLVRDVGGFSLAEGVRLVKLISKKKVDAIHAMREKFMAGAAEKGCPKDDALRIWDLIESAGNYLFNLSHATAYAITAYAGAWLKANYPTAFYTVALQYADDREIIALMSEMERCSAARIVPPDINRSQVQFYTDYGTDSIYWSLGRIKMIGVKTAEHIVRERERGGEFTGIEDFVRRIFRHRLKKYRTWEDDLPPAEMERVPVNARHMRHLILAGCFDRAEGIDSVADRYGILQRAAAELGFALDEQDYPADEIAKHHFWSRLQIAVAGIGSVDYRRIFEESQVRPKIKGRASYMSLHDALVMENEGKKVAICATVTDVEELSYRDKTTGDRVAFCKMILQQNTDTIEAVCWNDFFSTRRAEIMGLKDRIVVLTGIIRYSDFSGTNTLHTTKTTILSQE